MMNLNINSVAVIGSGQMGQGIAQVFAINGYQVILIDQTEDILKKAYDTVLQSCQKMIQKGLLLHTDYIRNIKLTTNFEELKNTQLIIEAVPENLDIKLETYKKVDAIMQDHDFILCTNTSALSLQELKKGLNHPDRFMGLHFMNPPIFMPLIELIVQDDTDQNVIRLVRDVVKSIKKEGVFCKDSPGFIVNRILIPMINEACLLLDAELSTIEDIDKAMKLGANFPMGPLTLADFIGLDTVLSIMETLQKVDDRFVISSTLKELVQKGELGRKTKVGFFHY